MIGVGQASLEEIADEEVQDSSCRGSGGVPQVITSQATLPRHLVMLNLFQHLSFQCINLEIPKQVRNDRESSSVVIASPDKSGVPLL